MNKVKVPQRARQTGKAILPVFLITGFVSAFPAKADVYKFVGKSGSPYYAARPSAGKAPGVPPRPRDVSYVLTPISVAYAFSEPTAVGDVNRWVDLAAQTYGLDPKLLHAVIRTESSYNAAAVSPKGAMGLMQLMPATAARFSVSDPLDAKENILGGSRYLRNLLGMFDQNLELALASYNAGEQNVIRYGRKVPPFSETQAYVSKVLDLYRR